MNSYRTSTWGDEISLEYGKSLKGYRNSNGKYQVFGSNGPIGWTDKPLCKGPGIILGRKGAYRGVKFSEKDFYVIDTAYYVVPKTDLDLNWLYYAIKYHKLGEIDDGSPIPSTTRAAVYVREFDIPSKEVQVKIGNILKKIDLKIELNNQINETLESIAQAIFKSWFIAFDPVRAKIAAKQEGKDSELAAMCVISGKSEVELQQMAKEDFAELQVTAALFPDELVESELGEVPNGWEVSTIGERFNVVMGQSPKGDTYNGNKHGKLFFQGRAEFGWRYPTPRLYTTDPKRVAKENDILMSVRAPVGDMNVAMEECCIGRGLSALSHRSGSFSYSYYCLKALQSKFDVFNGEGTVFGSINQNDLKNISFIEPINELIDLFAKTINKYDQRIKLNSFNTKSLIDVRDTLLPKLLSGELEVLT
ncbi:restriction endonuclease subunit S [Acinetobacter sp. ANC 4973]|uniref:restriction endonuclease subunit S n=1 Tax=Acinetobacter sp. ANC 4973 TaxID=1977871 RepID=UPI000A33B249|nr:restriction endonuclease subunit S [Acinetobacter sp. ANC 4973]OTG98729.1 hypothetical protein B9T30_11770 [Acinetobacter sp. ANC 4973]